MSESDSIKLRRRDIAPSVRALLAVFNEETFDKLALAPTDSVPIYQDANGFLIRAVDGWVSDTDAELDKADAITITPTGVRDIEEP